MKSGMCVCHEGGREVPAACPSGETWDISRGVQHLGILGESAGKPQPQNPGNRAASHLLMRGSQIADGSRQRGPGSCARASFTGWCVCVVQRCAGRGAWRSTAVPASNTAVTQENQLNMDVPSFPSRSRLGTVRAEIPLSSALESGPGRGQGKQVKGKWLQQQGWGRGHC